MVKVLYLGVEGSPKTTRTLGYEFRLNDETEVDDRDALVRLSKNAAFEVRGEIPADPNAKDRAQKAAVAEKALERDTREATAKLAAEADANAKRIADMAVAQAANRTKIDERRAAEIASFRAMAQARAQVLRKAAGHPEP